MNQPLPSPPPATHLCHSWLHYTTYMYSQFKLSLLSYTNKKTGSHTVMGSLLWRPWCNPLQLWQMGNGGGGGSEAEGGGVNIWIVPYMNCALFINFIIHTVQASISLANIQWKHITDWKEMSLHLFQKNNNLKLLKYFFTSCFNSSTSNWIVSIYLYIIFLLKLFSWYKCV